MINELLKNLKKYILRIIFSGGYLLGLYYTLQLFRYEPTGEKIIFVALLLVLGVISPWIKN